MRGGRLGRCRCSVGRLIESARRHERNDVFCSHLRVTVMPKVLDRITVSFNVPRKCPEAPGGYIWPWGYTSRGYFSFRTEYIYNLHVQLYRNLRLSALYEA